MVKLLKIAIAVLLAISLCILGFFTWLGGFTSITIEEQPFGPYLLAYRPLPVVEFSKVGEITTALNNDLRSGGVTDIHPFDIFYPDQRAEIGFIINFADSARALGAGPGIAVKTIPAQNYLTTNFPWRTPLSYFVGYLKIDGALTTYRNAHGYRKTWAATEHEGDFIRYLQPVEKE